MPESISRLMDGEVDDTEIEIVCGQLRRPDAVSTWVCYHVIGDALGSLGAIIAGVLIAVFGWNIADPAISPTSGTL